ncbi:MAG: hypothetical protein ACTSWQ_08825 [Candidatus Thorarchaeota archaeon]
MEERTKKAVIVTVLVLGGLGVSITYVGPLLTYGVSHHLEERVTDQLAAFAFGLNGLEDTNLTIMYRNDSSLLYEVDFTLYEPATFDQAMTITRDTVHWLFLNAKMRIQSMIVTLGTGLPYTLGVWSDTDLNTTMIFDNGAILDEIDGLGDEINYCATGILRLAITENVTVKEWAKFHFQSGSKTPDIVLLAIDLPEGVEGYLELGATPVSFSILDGWYFRGAGRYSTISEPYALPSVTIEVGNSDYVYASLRD